MELTGKLFFYTLNLFSMKNSLVFGLVVLLLVGGVVFLQGQKKSESISKVVFKGSDTEVQLISNLIEAFAVKNPGTDMSVTGGGSGVGIAALINKEADVANSSRKMKDEELAQAKQNGFDAQEFIMARDGLAVIVHPENLLSKLTLEQVGRLYRGEVKNWKELGGADEKVVLYGRQSTSGTYVFFRDAIVKGDYAADMRSMEGTQAIVDGVRLDKNGIGYVGLGYVKDDQGNPRSEIKVVPVALSEKDTYFTPLDTEAVKSGAYPITRPLYHYLANLPKRNSPLEKFLRFEMSDEGQSDIEKAGFVSLTPEDRKQNEALFANIQ